MRPAVFVLSRVGNACPKVHEPTPSGTQISLHPDEQNPISLQSSLSATRRLPQAEAVRGFHIHGRCTDSAS